MSLPIIATRRQPECKLAFHVERRPHFLRVAIRGEASFEQAEFLSAQLLRIALDACALVVLDLAELTFISSRAMHALVEYRVRLGRRGIDIRLANVPALVWEALESAGLGELFGRIDLDQQT